MIQTPQIAALTPIQKLIFASLISLGAVAYYLGLNLYGMSLGGPQHLDLATFYAAAQATFVALVSPYNTEVLQNYRSSDLAIIYPFLYPPSALPFFWPLSKVTLNQAHNFGLVLNCVLIAGLVMGGTVWTLRRTRSLIAALLMLVILTEGSRGLWATLWYGQINAVIAVLLLASLWALRQQYKVVAGILLGITITLKVYPVILLPWLVLRRDWKTLMTSVATIAALALLTWIWLPHYLWSDWLSKVVASGYGTQPAGLISAADSGNLNIHGVLMRSLSNVPYIKLLGYLSAIVLTVITFFTAYKRPEPVTAQFAVIMWLTLLIAPLTWLSHLTYVLFVPVWFLAMAFNARQYVWCGVFVFFYAYVLQLTQLNFGETLPAWQINLPCAGLIILWGMMQYQLWRSAKAT